MRRSVLAFAVVVVLSACGSPPAPSPPASDTSSVKAPPAAASSAEKPADPPASKAADVGPAFPVACDADAKKSELCVPSASLVDRLCRAASTDAALAMFGKDTPWVRAFLTRDTEAWNAGGGSSVKGKLAFDEEVILLRKREGSSMIVGQGASYDVLRWDGSCASLAQEEVTMKRPPKSKNGPVAWREIGQKTRDAILADAKLAPLFEKRRKECKGVTTGDVSAACVKADAVLSTAIVDAVRLGLALPPPALP